MFYGSQRITSRYLGSQLIWGKDLDVQSISFSHIFFYYGSRGYDFYNNAVVQLQLSSSDAQPLKGKNIVSVEANGKTSDVEWTFPTSGSVLTESYLTVESTPTTFNQISSKMKADYGMSQSEYVDVVVYYTD